ncbi:hypothetical protein [uncultured Microbacterium sp.]|uniref:hypothetical protein n=1 Tax=uncultured Microbacterium sp. TaxID=191216 RepID=UPI0035CB7658
MKTPIGGVDAVFTFTEADGGLHGTAASKGDVAEMRDLVAAEQPDGSVVLTWTQSVTKPMRLNLDFEVTVAGDSFSGFSKAGKLPKSVVTGTRA